MFFKKHTKQQDSSSSTSSQASSTRSSSPGDSYIIRDSTTAMPMSVNSMRTWEVQNKQQQQQQELLRMGTRGNYAHAVTNWDQKNEDLERRAQGLPLRSRSMKRSWKNRTLAGSSYGASS